MDNVTALKILFLLLTSAFWMPFAKALKEEFLKAMREDGGLFARVPPPHEQKKIREAIKSEPSPVIHILKGHLQSRNRPAAGQTQQSQSPGTVAGPQSGARTQRRFGR